MSSPSNTDLISEISKEYGKLADTVKVAPTSKSWTLKLVSY